MTEYVARLGRRDQRWRIRCSELEARRQRRVRHVRHGLWRGVRSPRMAGRATRARDSDPMPRSRSTGTPACRPMPLIPTPPSCSSITCWAAEGQDILFDSEQVDHPLVARSKGRGELEALQACGISGDGSGCPSLPAQQSAGARKAQRRSGMHAAKTVAVRWHPSRPSRENSAGGSAGRVISLPGRRLYHRIR